MAKQKEIKTDDMHRGVDRMGQEGSGVTAADMAEAGGNLAKAMAGVAITAEVAADGIWEFIYGVELATAVLFARIKNPAMASRYIHAKKKRTRKKYEKKILAWYREEVL